MPVRLLFVILIFFAVGSLAALFMRDSFVPSATQSGRALIGGPFVLTNQKGERVADEAFRGKYMLVSFGYTFCPDICPAELQLMTDALNELGPKGDNIVPVFITIDPKRDTVSQIAGYMESFHPRMVGLTGTEEEIKQAAGAYRVYYARADGAADDPNYLMDHSTFIYLMDPKGEYLAHFPYGITKDKLAERLLKATGG